MLLPVKSSHYPGLISVIIAALTPWNKLTGLIFDELKQQHLMISHHQPWLVGRRCDGKAAP